MRFQTVNSNQTAENAELLKQNREKLSKDSTRIEDRQKPT
jgi:hypothetical protein